MPKILFIHENFPAQFGKLAQFLHEKGWQVLFATAASGVKTDALIKPQGFDFNVIGYKRNREVSKHTHRYLGGTERAVLNGQALARVAMRLKKSGFEPDIIMAHSGWGSGSMAKIVWPDAKFVQYLEWWYSYPPVDVPDYDANGQDEDKFAATLCRNLPFLLDCQTADQIWVPTAFQAAQIPRWIGRDVKVIHDGVDCDAFRPLRAGDKALSLPGVPDDAQIITYATRGMEPTRGFPQFMRELSLFQSRNPDVHAVIGGEDTIHYGAGLPEGESWKKRMLAKYEFDLERTHFIGRQPLSKYQQLLRRTSAHVYLSQPFVLSWSLIEALASATPLVANDIAPIREVLGKAAPAKIVNMDEEGGICGAIEWHISNQAASKDLGLMGRKLAISSFDAKKIMGKKLEMLGELAELA